MPKRKPTFPPAKAYRVPFDLLDRLNAWRLEEQAKRGKRMSESEAVFELLEEGLKAKGVE